MKPVLAAATALLAASAALAHPGHVAEVSGHAHWAEYVAWGFGGLAVAFVAGRAFLRRKRDDA